MKNERASEGREGSWRGSEGGVETLEGMYLRYVPARCCGQKTSKASEASIDFLL